MPAPMPAALPIRIGCLYDFPKGDDSFARLVKLGIETTATGAGSTVRSRWSSTRRVACPSGSAAEMIHGFQALVDQDVLAIVGPAISDNALIVAPLCDQVGIPAINYTGGERTRSQWMFHYQVGSLEEEPPVLAGRMVERGLRRAVVVFDQSPVGRRYAECFEAARGRLGLEVAGTASISPLAEDAEGILDAPARRQTGRARVLRTRRDVEGGRRRPPVARLGRSRTRRTRR